MIVLALHNLRRVTRHRAVLAAIYVIPLASGIARAAFPESRYSLGLVWACPVICAFAAWAALSFQRAVDDAIGLTDALSNSSVGQRGLAASRFFAAILLILPPMVILALILAIT
jgi:hypothetical protein